MQNESELEYAKIKDFLSFFAERYLKAEGLPPDKQPIASLETLEKKSMRMAFNGLRQAINDCVEMSLHFDHAEVETMLGPSLSRWWAADTLSNDDASISWARFLTGVWKRSVVLSTPQLFTCAPVLQNFRITIQP